MTKITPIMMLVTAAAFVSPASVSATPPHLDVSLGIANDHRIVPIVYLDSTYGSHGAYYGYAGHAVSAVGHVIRDAGHAVSDVAHATSYAGHARTNYDHSYYSRGHATSSHGHTGYASGGGNHGRQSGGYAKVPSHGSSSVSHGGTRSHSVVRSHQRGH